MLMRKVLFLLLSVLFLGGQAFAQSRTVTGRVTDAKDGSGIPGATIQIKGTSKGTVTNPEGSFTLQVDGNATLVFSFIGYEQKEVPVGNASTVNVSLKTDAKSLEEVIVTGYTVEKKVNSTIAASTISGAKINNVALPDVNQMLQGNAPGVAVSTNSGQPGAKTEVRIRGVGSISASNAPIYVVDGVIVSSGDFTQNTATYDVISSINPADIENITVLKDASATALYGSRGSNGVIVITTKSGKKGVNKINFNAKYGVQNLARTIPMMNSSELLQYQREAMKNATKNDGTPTFTEAQILANRPDYLADINTDWMDLAFRTGKTQSYGINASGGNEKTLFYASGDYFKQDGILVGSNFSRYNGRLNVDHKFNDKFDLSFKVNGSYTDMRSASAGNSYSSPLMGALSNVPYIPAYDDNGNITNGYIAGQPGTVGWDHFSSIPSSYRPVLRGGNFLSTVANNYNKSNTGQTVFNVALGYNIIDGLRFVVKGSAEITNIREKQWTSPNSYDGRNYSGYLYNVNTNMGLYTTQQLLTYNFTVKKDHSFRLLAGNEYSFSNRVWNYSAKNGFPSQASQVPDAGSTYFDMAGDELNYAFQALIGKVDYDYKNKYFLSGSYRRDGSSRFPKDSRYGNFYSVGAAWRIIEEEWMKNVSWLNDLKVRSSYGVMGNAEGLGNYPYQPLYSLVGSYDGQSVAYLKQPANLNLSWEKQNLFDVGIDVAVLNRRLYGSFGFYDKRSSALLMEKPVSMTTGFSTMTMNVGKMMNQGFEITVGGVPVQTKNFQWTSDLNFATLKNKVLSLGGDQAIPSGTRQRIEVGMPFGSWYMPIWAGVNPETGAAQWIGADGKPTSVYTEAVRQYAGQLLPKITGGFTNKFNYKDFDLSVFITFSAGNKAYNSNRANLESDGGNTTGNQAKDALDHWQKPGDISDRPKVIWGNGSGSTSSSTRFLEDVSYAKLRNVQLGYNLPKSLLRRTKLQNLRVYAQAENLYTLTKYKGWDPEINTNPAPPTSTANVAVSNAGTDFYRYPTARVITFGINVGL
ncbi:TonB-linked outer membrane protein, SusC/RagA family [Chitinophaga terrae (ex Kim and Jung 2007)]|uniref:TonB-linked outer membrane protein, SusC/RagA family n=2 Tax=Chitinophaga terrae (ex Kim and Jung 2007) TaxID=408074 RepID=A0A1H4F999_9BACT|nr:TonB-linked outer membrane protein, SusC/RagA family [Chitinophaga terrae (ex Kim and Jung 2007)]